MLVILFEKMHDQFNYLPIQFLLISLNVFHFKKKLEKTNFCSLLELVNKFIHLLKED